MKKGNIDMYMFSKVLPEYYNAKLEGDGQFSRITAGSSTTCHTILKSIWPIFKLAQIIGIAPVTFCKNPSKNKKIQPNTLNTAKTDIEECGTLNSDWMSIPSGINIFMTFHLLWVTIWVLFNIKGLLSTTFQGTDLYMFCIEIQLYFVQSTVILVNSFFKRKKFIKLWNLLHRVYRCLNSLEYGNCALVKNGCVGHGTLVLHIYLKNLKRISFILVILVLIMGTAYSSYFLHFVLKQCFESKSERFNLSGNENAQQPACFWDSWPLLIEKMTYTVVEIYHQGISMLFWGVCLIVWSMHKEICKRLKRVLNTSKTCRAAEIERLRICHEKLMTCGKVMGDFFGFALIAACILSIVSFTSSIYTVLLGFTSMGDTGVVQTTLIQYLIIWIFHGIFGTMALALILIPGQMVQNAAEMPFQIIGSFQHGDLNSEEKYQITMFMQQKRSFSGISACNITTMGVGFYATAVTNVTTYMLVLLQFRLGVDKPGN